MGFNDQFALQKSQTVHVRFSNRPFGVKHFQTVHRCSVDVTRGLVLLFGWPAWLSRDANIGNGPNPPFGHVADLIASHRRKIIAKEKLRYDGRRAGFCHLRGHPFEKTLALLGRILNISQFESSTSQKVCGSEQAHQR